MFELPDGSILQARYTVGQPIGRGGYAYTYRGVDTRLNRLVAIKELFPSEIGRMLCMRKGKDIQPLDMPADEFVECRVKFLSEAQMLAGIGNHWGVVTVHDFFEENNTAYLVMELLDGETLYQHCLGKRISIDAAVAFIRQIVEPLAYVHGQGIIHRDLNPKNVMLTRDGRVVLIDFGLSKLQSQQSQSLTMAGFSGFAPPEQYRASRGKPEPTIDIYSLMALLYFMLTGHVPEDASSRFDHDTGTDSLLSPKAHRPEISTALAAVVLEGMSLGAGKRPKTVQDLLSKLDAATAPPKPEPPRPRSPYAPNTTEYRNQPEFVQAKQAYDKGDYDTAFPLFARLAPDGDAHVQNYLGMMYANGEGGLARDNVEAVRLYRLAADQGDADAQSNLGFMYECGKGVGQDLSEAVRLYQLSAAQGNEYAKNNLKRLQNESPGLFQIIARLFS